MAKDTIRLVFKDSVEAHLPYVTLSHCWGTGEFFVLAPDLVPRFREGVDISEFPLTFQETIITVRRLGVRYLWIDCYCVMQGRDDEAQEDWRSESLHMGKIYANSLLNIGALESEGPANGLFRYRRYNPIYFKIQWLPDGRGGIQNLYVIPPYLPATIFEQFDQVKYSALMKRGWVVQECVMAPRMLSFGQTLFWQCDHLAATEQLPYEPISHHKEDDALVMMSHPFWLLNDPVTRSRVMIRSYESRWINTLSVYTKTRLSYPQKDLFAALNGVGIELAKRSGSIFRNGILASALQQSLLFESNCEVGELGQAMPTWHWSSRYPQVDFRYAYLIHLDRRWFSPMAYSFMSDDCRALPDGFSKSYWPNLILIGRLLTKPLNNQHDRFDGEKGDGFLSNEEKVYVPLFRDRQRRDSSLGVIHFGLILVQSKSGAYRRLGQWSAFPDRESLQDALKVRPQLIVLE